VWIAVSRGCDVSNTYYSREVLLKRMPIPVAQTFPALVASLHPSFSSGYPPSESIGNLRRLRLPASDSVGRQRRQISDSARRRRQAFFYVPSALAGNSSCCIYVR
jgi:hypothetical protein